MIRSIIFKKKGVARLLGRLEPIAANTGLLTASEVKCFGPAYSAVYLPSKEWLTLQSQYLDLIQKSPKTFKVPDRYKGFEIRWVDPHAREAFDTLTTMTESSNNGPFLGYFLLILSDWSCFLDWAKRFVFPLDAPEKIEFCLQVLGGYATKGWPTKRYAELTDGSIRKLNRLVRQHGEGSIKRWLNQEQLIRTTWILAQTDLPIAQVALVAGFKNHAYFSAKFKQVFHCTPRLWRALHRATGKRRLGHLFEEVIYGHQPHPEPNA